MSVKTLTLRRIISNDQSTVGILTDNLEFLATIIEDPFRESKVYGRTRIPEGHYRIIKRKYGGFYQRYKDRFGHSHVYELQGVEGFTDILIHIGNFPEDTRGCLLVNEGFRIRKSDNAFIGYRSTGQYLELYDQINAWFKDNDSVLLIVEDQDR